jgi:hypothetical protein
MISPSFDIHQFIENVKEKDPLDRVSLAEQEAVLTWRQSYTRSGSLTEEQKNGMLYENKLLKIIDYIRYGIIHRDIAEIDPELLSAIR